MSTIQRQIVWCAGFSLLVAVIFTAAFISVFPLTAWSDLWNSHFMDIPFAIFIPVSSIILGVIFGIGTGLFWKGQLRYIDDALHQLEEGKQMDIKAMPPQGDLQLIAKRLEKINRQISAQAKVSQRLATERAEEQESRIQGIISQERNRLARELHDSVSQQLFAASMMMSAINEPKQSLEDPETKQLRIVEQMIHQSQLEMRALLLHLRPIALKNKSLQEGMKELLTELSQKVPMNIQWKVEDFSLDKGVEDHLFRILQESVSNTLRHAKATKLEVLLINRDDLIIMRVVDDGIGFNADKAKAGSYGLQTMQERALEIGGTLKIVSVKNKGTRLEVKVPNVVNGDGAND